MHDTYNIESFSTRKEDKSFDRKSARKEPKEILRHLIGFANADGGLLVIGIEDDGQITGFNYPKAHRPEDFIHALKNLQKMPIPVTYQLLDVRNNKDLPDHILVFEISSSNSRVIVSHDDKVFLRSKDQTLELSFEQRLQLEYEKSQRVFEDQPIERVDFEDLDLALLEEYRLKLQTNRSIEEILQARDLMTKDGKLTNACILLFGKNPTRYFPNARLRFLRYEGKAPLVGKSFNVVKELMLEEPIPRLIESTKSILKNQLREFQRLDDNGKFIKIDEYPEFAWLEGVVNAVTHRSYSNQGDCIRISMFDDRLEIFSPGGLPRPVTLENMYYTRFSRNPRIARVLYEFGWVKELNEGVNRMIEEMKAYQLNSPLYLEPNDNSVKLILENNIEHRTLRELEQIEKILTEDLMDTLSQYEILVLQHLYTNKTISVKVVKEILNRSHITASRILKGLEQKGILTWHGLSPKDPTQYYTLKK
ncbi:ATP-dependent DNA helicase RecG [[Haemophilus] felis]|uniref:ATP-dependent DNA helicase RecG n=1 Tax=[Haemophilus] felis TaxID=123822 RepID=A0A1T0AZY7_9PAST|nr:ATP-dependent DNA helicase RecG [[Haemophilus] felis]NBI40140.1 ATP-dependent DNA helicase RecG [[Haemophilus] felis]OOS03513.1 ATP-dependent DNA helicase RecG [[Haemophilus] felis]